MIQEYLRGLPDRLGDLKLPAANHRAVWDGLPEGVRAALIRRGEEYLGWHWPVMTCGDYLTFSRTGDRSRMSRNAIPVSRHCAPWPWRSAPSTGAGFWTT